MRRIFFCFFTILFLTAVYTGCPSDPGTEPTETSRLVHTDITLELVDTTAESAYSDTTVSKNARALAAAPGETVITEKAVVSSPVTSSGIVMQASDVSMGPNGKYAFVTYMLKGDNNSGMLDIIDISDPSWPVLSYSIDFSTTDLSAAAYDGSYIYIGGQSLENTTAGEYAYIRAIKFTGNKPDTSSEIVELHLPGYFMTDIAADGNLVYVTTGTENQEGTLHAGFFIFSFDGTSFTQVAHVDMPDARSVAVSSSKKIAVFEAASIQPYAQSAVYTYTYAKDTLSPDSVTPVETDILDESKAGIDFIGSYILLAANKSGVRILTTDSPPSLTATIPAPSLITLSPELQPSNAVSAGFANSKTIYFISNGEAGLWVGDAGSVADSGHGLSGSIRFSNGISVNDVAAKNSTVVAAAGTGGVRILELAPPPAR